MWPGSCVSLGGSGLHRHPGVTNTISVFTTGKLKWSTICLWQFVCRESMIYKFLYGYFKPNAWKPKSGVLKLWCVCHKWYWKRPVSGMPDDSWNVPMESKTIEICGNTVIVERDVRDVTAWRAGGLYCCCQSREVLGLNPAEALSVWRFACSPPCGFPGCTGEFGQVETLNCWYGVNVFVFQFCPCDKLATCPTSMLLLTLWRPRMASSPPWPCTVD